MKYFISAYNRNKSSKILLTIFIVLYSTHLFSQNTGNEWININQLYYKFNIPETGIYKVTSSELTQAGVPIGDVLPQNIQLFQNGKEIPCYISEAEQGIIDYILFYAKKNDGWFDTQMYDDPTNQTNPYYSLINDTAAVFITWNTSIDNKRFTLATDIDFSGYTPENYCFATSLQQYTSSYYPSYEDCEYIEGEGWFDNRTLLLGASLTKNIPTPGFIDAGVSGNIEFAYVSYSQDVNTIVNTHHIQASCPGMTVDSVFSGYKTIKYNRSVNFTSFNDITPVTFKSIDDQEAVTSKVVVSYIKIDYTRNFNADGLSFFNFSMPPSSSKKYIEVNNFNVQSSIYLFDITNGTIISTTEENGVLKALLPSTNTKSEYILTNDDNFLKTDKIVSAPMINHSAKNKKYIIISNPLLWQSAAEYASYRNAYLVNIEELYDQFGYGIEKHPMAIRNFLRYVFSQWSVKPTHLLLIGKGLQPTEYRKATWNYSKDLVPTMGYPGSDVLLSNGVNTAGYESALATGRIAAKSNDVVISYLNKVREFEQNPNAEWMKRGIHFGGGKTEDEQIIFKNYLLGYERTFEDSLFGGFITGFYKTSSDPIEMSVNDSVKSLVNNGVSIMTFFGHGSAQGGFDQNIDSPESFDNKSKYPLMCTNSCYSGNIHLANLYSASEDWVLIPEKGAIGFVAVVGKGYSSYLNIFTDNLYKNFSLRAYGKTIGECIRQARIDMQTGTVNRYKKITIQEMTLHGDPAIVLNSFPKPDLRINANEIFFDPQIITTQLDSFDVYVVITNSAKTTNNNFYVSLTRQFTTGKETYYDKLIHGLLYKDTVKFKLPVDNINGLGNNTFTLHIDTYKQIDELDETNNVVQINKFISSNDIVPIYPYKYALCKSDDLVLKANTADAFAKEQSVIMEIDTSYLFDSPTKITENMTVSGGVVKWIPSIDKIEGTTYFWRTAAQEATIKWIGSSFTINNIAPGWEQSDYGQFTEDDLKFLERDDDKKEFVFSKTPKTLVCKNLGSPSTETEFRSIGYTVDGLGESSSCGPSSAMIVAVIDSLTLIPWLSNRFEQGTIGHVNDPWCYSISRPQYMYSFHSGDINNIVNLVNFIENKVPDGNYIVIYSFRDGNYPNYNEYIRSAFESWGAQNIRFLDHNIPYIFFVKKGDPTTAIEVVGADTESDIDLYENIKTNFTYGYLKSKKIGPAKSWETLQFDYHTTDNTDTADITSVSLYGIDNNDNEILLADSIETKNYNLSGISSDNYPYLKIQFNTRDNIYRTPAQLDYWRVYYEPVADIAINPQRGYEFYNDTLHQGENGHMIISFENTGYCDVDSTVVNYWSQSSKNQIVNISTQTIKPLKKGEFITDTVNFSTLEMSGNQIFWSEINPAEISSDKFIREQYYFNNIAQRAFYVKPDPFNPLLDITFDGVHIMDGDLISSRPEIVIQLKDENNFIPLDDTSLIVVYLKSKNTGIEKKIALANNPEMSFIPGKLPENKARLIYTPSFVEDGTYELRVQAKDKSGNESGSFDYSISFEVITESSITNVFNYPNPFSTSTRFVFELTGYELPDEMRIEILTVTGKVVKVIFLEDLGPLHIGKNITQYIWNGTDMYGDPLANGVYFYRVNARLNGKEMKIRDTGTNQYFKNGFGKMYIIR